MNLVEHGLKENDSLEKLSAFYGIPVCMIFRANGFLNSASLEGIHSLKIPDRQYCMRAFEAGKKSYLHTPFIEYKVQEGDTIYEIAQKHRTTMNIIARFNRINDPERLSSGQNLKILKTLPGSVRYFVKAHDTIKGLSGRFHIPEKCICAFNCLPENSGIYPGMQLIIPQPTARPNV